MQCEKCREYIHEYIDSSLSEDKMLSMTEHFEQCSDCQTFLDEEIQFSQITASLLEESASNLQLRESVKNNILNAVRKNQQTIRFSYSFWAKVAAVALVAGILSTSLFNIKQESKTIEIALTEHGSTSLIKANQTRLTQSQMGTAVPAPTEKNNKHFKSICTTYDKVNKKHWIRRNVIVENPDGKPGFINITVTRPNSG